MNGIEMPKAMWVRRDSVIGFSKLELCPGGGAIAGIGADITSAMRCFLASNKMLIYLPRKENGPKVSREEDFKWMESGLLPLRSE